ncbi:peritrophin-1-like isoform X2 [Megachile rotundata]
MMTTDLAHGNIGKEMWQCKGKGNSTYTHHVPHETDCHKFYKCLGGKGYEKQCPDDLVFNPIEQVCDWEENVPGACSGQWPPTTSSTTTSTRPTPVWPPITSPTPSPTTSSTTTPRPPPVADGCPVTGRKTIRHETNCHYYYICSNGLKEQCRCYGEHRYNPVVGNCDLPENVRCHGEGPVSSDTPKYGLCPPQAFYPIFP